MTYVQKCLEDNTEEAAPEIPIRILNTDSKIGALNYFDLAFGEEESALRTFHSMVKANDALDFLILYFV